FTTEVVYLFSLPVLSLLGGLPLSDVGEKLVDEEVRRALYGVKQMKEVLVKNEEKHEHLMKSLRHSSDKKKGAAKLSQEVKLKLQEAEHQCQESLKEEWEACWLCLEDACKTFYTSTCRQGFSTFQNLFRRVSSPFGQRDPRLLDGDMLVNQSADRPDREVVRIEDSFNNLIAKSEVNIHCPHCQFILLIHLVVSEGVDGGSSSGVDTKVELNILNSPSLFLTIPAGVELQDPGFIQYVTQEALGMYKQMFR
uniref:Clusterin-like protein 1 n=1 Tax=Hucho hucho TaxID=62062 RepID=A0A4W5R3V2_9TELE